MFFANINDNWGFTWWRLCMRLTFEKSWHIVFWVVRSDAIWIGEITLFTLNSKYRITAPARGKHRLLWPLNLINPILISYEPFCGLCSLSPPYMLCILCGAFRFTFLFLGWFDCRWGCEPFLPGNISFLQYLSQWYSHHLESCFQ